MGGFSCCAAWPLADAADHREIKTIRAAIRMFRLGPLVMFSPIIRCARPLIHSRKMTRRHFHISAEPAHMLPRPHIAAIEPIGEFRVIQAQRSMPLEEILPEVKDAKDD